MRNSIAHGRQVAIRTSLLQFGATVIAALIAAIFGWRTGVATFAGGAIIVVGNGLFALRLFAEGVAPVRNALRAEVIKWAWLCLALALAIAVLKLPFAGLIAGVLVAQFAFWIALIAIR